MKIKFLISLAAVLSASIFAGAENMEISSPDGRNVLTVSVSGEGGTTVSYSFSSHGKDVILNSLLDVTFSNHTWEMATGKRSVPKLEKWFDNLILQGSERDSADTLWHNPFGERSTVRDAWNGVTLHFVKDDTSLCSLDIEFRVYNEGMAFRYRLPMHPDALYHRVIAENSEFALPEGTMAWHARWAQAQYEKLPLKDWDEDAERPLTLELPGGMFAALGEAGTIDFPRCKFSLSQDRPSTVVTSLNDNATDLVTPYDFPWRYVIVADRLGGLLENNDLVLNLSEACRIADTGWIRPGKIIRETRLTTENSLKCIDFAARHGMNYILYDWKWYGPSFDFSSDATEVTAPIDMAEVVRYGKEKGVGVWVYVNQHALQKQGADLFPVYEKWGLMGVKFGFVHFTSQMWSSWVHSLVRKAADSHIMVNIHDEYRPVGYSRTWPNLLTQEGICGNEEFPSATHNTVLPFTRMLCGAADYTVCYFDPRLKNTHAHQLALPVMYFSPLQTLFWYDTPDRIVETPELEFFDRVPTVWDDTKVLVDDIGHCASIARRSGDEWFLGAIASDEGACVEIPTSFLTQGGRYIMSIYTDDPYVDSPTKVACRRFIVTGGDALRLSLMEKGGAAAIFTPATKESQKGIKKLKKSVTL